MDWHAYATRVEKDLEAADENNKKLKQEVRELQKQLIEAGSSPNAQQQITRLRQEAADDRKRYVGHLNNVQGQLRTAQQARFGAEARQQELLIQLDNTSRELKETLAETQKLRNQLAEQSKLLQQAALPQATPAPKSTVGARENARLEGLSNHNPNKPYDESDDSEPEYPSPSSTNAKKTPQLSNCRAGFNRPANPIPSPAPTPVLTSASYLGVLPTPAATSIPATTPKPTATRTPKPTVTAKTTAGKKATPVDLTASDDERRPGSKPEPKPVTSSSQINMGIPSVGSTQGLKVSAPPKKRKRGEQEQEQAPVPEAKRKRSKQELEDEALRNEVSELNIDGFGYSIQDTAAAAGLKSKRNSSSNSRDIAVSEEDLATASMDFHFRAICNYHDPQTISESFSSSELEGVVADLWERIEHVQNIWEKRGDDWQWEFTKKGANPRDEYFCVTRKCQRKRTNWGAGREPGMFACTDCVKAGFPCFTHTKNEFQLLPLHGADRKAPVVKDKEVRWWINGGVMLAESDDEMEYS